jgi:hypothetical protein
VSFSSTALKSIIRASFEGSQKKFALESDLEPTVISKLCQDQVFTKKTLAKVCAAMSQRDAESMAHAVARDLIPENCHGVLGKQKSDLEKTFPPLDEQTEKVIFQLAELASKDEATREWLNQLSSWMFKK